MTVGKTTINTATVIEHAVRRCGIPAEKQTPDILKLARENLFFLFTSYGNRGVPLWCVSEQYLPITTDKIRYECIPGTVDVQQVNYRTCEFVSGVSTPDFIYFTSVFTTPVKPVMFGLTCTSSNTLTLAIEQSNDGIVWTQFGDEIVIEVEADVEYWHELDQLATSNYFRLRETKLTNPFFSTIRWVESYTDRLMTRMSRDQYLVLPNKHTEGNPVQYMFDRQITPQLVIWPSPAVANGLLHVSYQREVADVGKLTETLDIPTRWIEATIWQLAKRLVMSIPGLDPQVKAGVLQLAAENQLEVEAEDVDNAPVMVQPAIGVYTA